MGKGLEDDFAKLDEQTNKNQSDDKKDQEDDELGGPNSTLGDVFTSGRQTDPRSLFNTTGGMGTLGGVNQMGGIEGMEALGGLLDNLSRALSGRNTSSDSIEKQACEIGRNVALEGRSEPNVDPDDRMAIERIMRAAEMYITDVTGIEVSRDQILKTEVVTRTQWVDRTINAYSKLFGALAQSMMAPPDSEDLDDNLMSAGLAQLMSVVGPTMLAVTAGSMVGRLAHRTLNSYLLPIPRPMSDPLMVLMPNVEDFKRQWVLPDDELRFWTCLNEITYRTVFSVKHVRARVNSLMLRYAKAFDSSTVRLENLTSDFDFSIGDENTSAQIHAIVEDPNKLLNSIKSPAQERIQPELTAVITAITGYVDYVTDVISYKILNIPRHPQLTEAMKRHRTETGAADRFPERMLGLELNQTTYDRGASFVQGVLERAGDEGLNRLFAHPANLPTPPEVDAPGLWLARIDLPY